MKKLGLMILILSSLLCINKADASHMNGGNITWACVGQDSFLITIIMYGDCNGITIYPIPLNFKNAQSGSTITSSTIAFGTPVDITPVCNSICTRCRNSGCSFPFGISQYTAQGIVRLNNAGSCCKILITWESGSRNYSSTSSACNLWIESIMDRCQNPCDNSPVFNDMTYPILCLGRDYTLDFGVTDQDADSNGTLLDSFTYEMTPPLEDHNTPVQYNGQYSYTKPIYFYGFPNDAMTFPGGFHLNSQTGILQFRPQKSETTCMAVKATEFRNGLKIAEITHDMFVYVIACISNNTPSITTPNNIRSKSVCPGDTVTFNFSASDVNANDSVTLSWNNAIPGATWSHTNGQSITTTATLTWTPSISQVSSRPYTFTVTAKDNGCPINAQITQVFQIIVNPVPEASITLTDNGCGKYYFRAVPITGNWLTYKWSSDSFTFYTNGGLTANHTFLPGLYPFKLEVTTPGCSRIFYDTVICDTFMSVNLPADTTVHIYSTILLQAMVANATGPYSLQWGTGKNTVFSGDTTLIKQITITKDTSIWIRARYGSFNCPFDEIRIKVHPFHKISLPEDTFFCDLNHVISTKFSSNQAAFSSFRWYQDVSPIAVDSDAFLNVFDTGLFTCVAIDTFGNSFTDSIRIHLNPAVIASAPDTTICSGKNVSIYADSVSNHQYSYAWWLNNTLLSSSKLLNVSPPHTTQYSLITTEFLNGLSCSDTHNITVFVKPLPALSFDKFDKSCAGGRQIQLDNFVKVNGQRVYDGTWTCPDEPSQVGANIFFSQTAYVNTNPGYKLVYMYTDTNTGCFNSDTVYLLVYPGIAKPQIKVTGDTIFCNGYSVSLESATTSTHYGWTTGDTVKQITVTTSGKYRLAVTAVNGCVSDSSLPVKVVVNPKPPTPVITLSPSDSFLECNLINGLYEWYFRSDTLGSPTIINNSTKRIDPKNYCQDCYFNIFFTDTNGCISNSSVYYYFHNNSIDHNYLLSSLKFYPNPAHSLLFAEFSGIEPAKLILTNILGNTILQTKIIPGKNEISLTNCKSGIYFIFLDGRIAAKLIID